MLDDKTYYSSVGLFPNKTFDRTVVFDGRVLIVDLDPSNPITHWDGQHHTPTLFLLHEYTDYVKSLKSSQRAVLGARLLPTLRLECRNKNIKRHIPIETESSLARHTAPIWQLFEEAIHCSYASVKRAAMILNKSPEAFYSVKSGALSLHKAYDTLFPSADVPANKMAIANASIKDSLFCAVMTASGIIQGLDSVDIGKITARLSTTERKAIQFRIRESVRLLRKIQRNMSSKHSG